MFSRRLAALILCLGMALLACPGPDDDDSTGTGDDDTTEAWSYPLDDTLTLSHLQALGTHNSYHLETGETPVPAWDYSHLPLDEQLGLQGVRQFELDINRSDDTGEFEVFHVWFIDQSSTCPLLADCLMAMKDWSDRNPAHHPFLTLLEVKDPYQDEVRAAEYLDALEDEILAVWPRDRLVAPDLVQGDAANLRDAIAERGWPSLGETRGRAIFVLHEGGGYRSVYTDGDTTTAGRAMFPDCHGDLTPPYAAVHSMNDPVGGQESIQAVVDAGHLVRTRADSDSGQALALDYTRLGAALSSGAHFISTDYPAPHYETGYVVEIPEGTPSACNPRTAPEGCTSEAIEDPHFIGE